jgi:DNA topoisomerase-1
LVEVSNDKGTYLVCPNNRETLPKRRPRKGGPAVEEPTTPPCTFEKKIGPPRPKEEPEELKRPNPEKTRTLVEAVA